MYLRSAAIVIIAIVAALPTEIDASTCSRWGQACRDNDTLVFCMFKDDEWIEAPIMKCPDHSQCDLEAAACSPAYASGLRFDCYDEGTFPDPYNCERYYVCHWDNGHYNKIHLYCPPGKNFSAQLNMCSRQQASECEPQNDCKLPGEKNAWPGNANIYYVCAVNPDGNNPLNRTHPFLYRTLYRCQGEMVFHENQCVNRECTSSSKNQDHVDEEGESQREDNIYRLNFVSWE